MTDKYYICILCLTLLMNAPFSSSYAQSCQGYASNDSDVLSEEDKEIIKMLIFLEELDFLEENDPGFIEYYERKYKRVKDQGVNDEN